MQYISQGSVATQLRCDQTFDADIVSNLLPSQRVKENAKIHRESKKQDRKLLLITSPNRFSKFSKFFRCRLSGKFATNSCLNILLHFKCVDTLLCSKNRNAREVIKTNCHVKTVWKYCLVKNIHYLIHWQKYVYTSHTKSHYPTVHNCCNKEKYVAAKCRTWPAVGQLRMA